MDFGGTQFSPEHAPSYLGAGFVSHALSYLLTEGLWEGCLVMQTGFPDPHHPQLQLLK